MSAVMSEKPFRFGTCTVPNGRVGPWEISQFEITNAQTSLANLRALRDNPMMYVPDGTYKRLTHKKRGVIMSNTPMEIRTNRKCFLNARGHVLINGLGMGMVIEGLQHSPNVTRMTIIEIDPDVIALVGPHFASDPRIEIVQADAFEFKPPKGARYGYVWHDIWDELSANNFPAMAKLNRKYARIADAQGTWSRDEVRAEERRCR